METAIPHDDDEGEGEGEEAVRVSIDRVVTFVRRVVFAVIARRVSEERHTTEVSVLLPTSHGFERVEWAVVEAFPCKDGATGEEGVLVLFCCTYHISLLVRSVCDISNVTSEWHAARLAMELGPSIRLSDGWQLCTEMYVNTCPYSTPCRNCVCCSLASVSIKQRSR